MTQFKHLLIAFLLILTIATSPTSALPPQYNEISPLGESNLTGKIFVDSAAAGYSVEYTADDRISITSTTHESNKQVRLNWTALQNVNGWSYTSAKVTHINDAGDIDSERIVNFGAPDAQGFVYFTTDFSTVIIGGYQGSYTISCGGVQDNSTNCSLGQSFQGGNVSVFTGTITPATTESSKYDYIASLNPVLWLPLDDNYTDMSGNGNNGTGYGDIHFENGKYNNGSNSDGDLDYITTTFNVKNNVPDNYSFSVVFDSVLFQSTNEEFFGTSGLPRFYARAGNTGYLTIGHDTFFWITNYFLDLDNLHNYIITYDNSTDYMYVYVDNLLVDSKEDTGTHLKPDNELFVLSSHSTISLNATVDNLLIFNFALNGTERNNLYYDHLQSLRIKSTTNATWSDYYNSTADNPISINYNIGETISALQFDVPTTAVIDGVTIYDYNKTAQFTPSATVYYGENVTLVSESAAAGIYTLNITQTPANAGAGWINYTTSNTLLLNADFNNTHTFTTDNGNASVQINLPYINISTGDINANEQSYYQVEIDYFYPPAGLTATPDTDHVYLNWTATPNADKYSVYELEEGIPWFDTQPTLDGIIDDIYLELSHHFHINSPNPVNTNDFDVLYMGRDATWVYLSGTAIDNDGHTTDDYARLYTDFTKNGLTTDDLMYEIKENGATARYSWSGSAWVPSGGSGVTGTTTGAGTNLITYELRVPVSELPANWLNGTNVSMMLERECTSLNPDVYAYYPFGNINATDTSLWQDIKLTNTSEYAFIANTTNITYNATGLIPYNWYRFAVSAWNGSQETSYSLVNVTTLDTPSYNISGYIIDSTTGLGIAGAQVWAVNGFISARETTNATGYYFREHFHNDSYRIFANATGYTQNNTTYFTISGADVTNKNVTLTKSNYDNFTFTNLAYTTPIKEYQPTTITVDINDSDGTITSAIIKIHGSNHTMQYISGDQWRYIYSSGIITNHYITNIYATDNSSGTNSTTYTTDYISILSRAGGGGGGGGIVIPPQDEEEPDVVEITITANVSDAVDFVENVTKGIANIISGDSFSMLRINTNPFQPSYAKTIMISGVVDATSTDPNVDVGAVNNEVIVITRPPVDGTLFYQYDTSIDIVLDTGVIEHRDYSVMVIDLMAYIPLKEVVMQNANPYIFKPSGVSSVEGLRLWWIVMLLLIGAIVVKKQRGKKR